MELEQHEECPKCHGDGYIRWEENGYKYAKECTCGIRRKRILQEQLQFAEIPDMYKGCTFKNLRNSVYQNPKSKEIFLLAAKQVNYWIENIEQMKEQGIGLYIYSNTKGSGKTRLACSIANELMTRYQKTVKFTTVFKILEEIKATWNNSSETTENKLIRDLTYADILIIDDFGADSGKDWINERFYSIINGRYIQSKITIYTSNCRISDLRYDDRITNRILERSLEIPFPEESVREHIADAMKQELIKKIQGGENGKQA